MQAMCLGCGQSIEIHDLPEPMYVNLPDVTMIVITHTRRSVCPNCNCQVAGGINSAAKLGVCAIPIPDEHDKPSIVPVAQMPKFLRN